MRILACIFIHLSLNYKTRDDLSTCTEDGESLSIEIINKTTKNVIITTSHRPPAGKMKPFKNFLKQVLSKNLKSNKAMYLVGDFNLNVLDYESNIKVKNFFNLLFQHSLISVINKPTRVTNKSATAIDHIMTNSFLNSNILTGIIKNDISYHFPIFVISNSLDVDLYPEHKTIFKRHINDN